MKFYEPIIIGFVSVHATFVHTILLLNPLWFRKRLLDWFERTHVLKFLSAWNWR